MEASNRIGNNLGYEKTPLITVKWVLPPSKLNHLFWGPTYRKGSHEKHPFCIFFAFHPVMRCLITLDSMRHACDDK